MISTWTTILISRSRGSPLGLGCPWISSPRLPRNRRKKRNPPRRIHMFLPSVSNLLFPLLWIPPHSNLLFRSCSTNSMRTVITPTCILMHYTLFIKRPLLKVELFRSAVLEVSLRWCEIAWFRLILSRFMRPSHLILFKKFGNYSSLFNSLTGILRLRWNCMSLGWLTSWVRKNLSKKWRIESGVWITLTMIWPYSKKARRRYRYKSKYSTWTTCAATTQSKK